MHFVSEEKELARNVLTIGERGTPSCLVSNLSSFTGPGLTVGRRCPCPTLGFTACFAVFLHQSIRGFDAEMKTRIIQTLAALSIATSANPRRTSHGATKPDAGNSPLSSSSISDELALVTLDDEGRGRLEPEGVGAL